MPMAILKFDLSRVNKDFGLNDLATEKLQKQFKELDSKFTHYTFEQKQGKGLLGYLRGKRIRGGERFLSSVYKQKNGTGKFDLKPFGIEGNFYLPETQISEILRSEGEITLKPCFVPFLPKNAGTLGSSKNSMHKYHYGICNEKRDNSKFDGGNKVA